MNEAEQTENIIEQAETQISRNISVRYTLYESDGSYSIEATVCESDESALVRDISVSLGVARRIFSLICGGGVTPCCIFEVTEDLIEVILEE